jgi:hypothetical protein
MLRYIQQWTGMRLLRLLVGIAAIVQGAMSPTPFLWVIGAVLVVQAFLNISCAGGTCAVPVSKQTNPSQKNEEPS